MYSTHQAIKNTPLFFLKTLFYPVKFNPSKNEGRKSWLLIVP
jgi:hypothetical protein